MDINRNQIDKKACNYITRCINSEAYELNIKGKRKKLEFLFNTFIDEKVKYNNHKEI